MNRLIQLKKTTPYFDELLRFFQVSIVPYKSRFGVGGATGATALN
jgi:hypothetical protein